MTQEQVREAAMEQLRIKFHIPERYKAMETTSGMVMFVHSGATITIVGDKAVFFYGMLFTPWRPCKLAS
jgi:hypothetical protein